MLATPAVQTHGSKIQLVGTVLSATSFIPQMYVYCQIRDTVLSFISCLVLYRRRANGKNKTHLVSYDGC